MKKFLFMSFLSLLIISCNTEEKSQEQQTTTVTETVQETPQEQPAENTEQEITQEQVDENTEEVYDDSIDIATEKLEKELTEFYKDKGISDVSIAAYAKGVDIVLTSNGTKQISKEEFEQYAKEISSKTKQVRETPEAIIKFYLQIQENGTYKDIYTGEF